MKNLLLTRDLLKLLRWEFSMQISTQYYIIFWLMLVSMFFAPSTDVFLWFAFISLIMRDIFRYLEDKDIDRQSNL